ncbi:MAG: hypothetical protein H0V17_29415 [Deltaproteobacteria bacterium]|nr:hypothetical protein [Deltaproteobacteria bacterium]
MARLWVAGLLIAAACGKGDKPSDKPAGKPADPATPADKPAEPAVKPTTPEAPAAKIKQATNTADLALLPIDSDQVLGVNLALIQTSPMWKEFIAPRVMSDDVKARLDEIKQKCNFDPMAVVKSASIGLKDGAAGKEGVVVVHGPDKAAVTACAEKMKTDKDAKVDITQDGDVTILKPKSAGPDTPSIAFMFTSDDTAVIVVGPKATGAGVKAVVAATGGLSTSNAFVDMYNRLETEKSLWMLMNGKAKAFQPLAMAGVKPSHVFGSLDVSDGLNLDLRMRLASQDQATQAATMMKSQLAPAAGMLNIDKIDVGADGQDLKLGMIVSKANVPKMLKSLQGLMSMGGGAGMGNP